MRKYPKNYRSFINWMYKKAIRRERESGSFRIMRGFDKNGKLDSVVFMEIETLFREKKRKIESGSFYPICGANLKYDRVESDMHEKEFIALAFADYDGITLPDKSTRIPDGKHVRVRDLTFGATFVDDSGVYDYLGVEEQNGKTYYIIEHVKTGDRFALRTSAFCDCTVNIANFYDDLVEYDKPERKIHYIESRDEFTEIIDKINNRWC